MNVYDLWQVQVMWYQTWLVLATFVVTAVAASFVLLQLRGLKKAAQSQTYQNIIANELPIYRMFADDPSLNVKFWDPNPSVTAFDPTDPKPYWVATMYLSCWENAYIQKRLKTIPKGTWPHWERYIARAFVNSGELRAVWEVDENEYSDEFRKFLGSDEFKKLLEEWQKKRARN